ncbi:MAG: TolC family protein [Bryobacterales bacterium]|nr:TolC family protein [Bryobacterales bacterium]
MRPRDTGEGVVRYRVSGTENLIYVAYEQDLRREVEEFRRLAPFSRLTVLTMWRPDESLNAWQAKLSTSLGTLPVEISLARVGTSAAEALDIVPSDTEAVLLDRLPQLSSDQFTRLVDGLTARRLPTYSLAGQADVRAGVMASLKPDGWEQLVARRIGFNLRRIVNGERAADIPVDFGADSQLTINLDTARAVGVDPSFAALTEARVISGDITSGSRLLSLETVVREAINANLDLSAASRRLEAGAEHVKIARAALRPRSTVTGAVDRPSGINAAFGSRQFTTSVGVSQTLYSEAQVAGYSVERNSQVIREQEVSTLRLDVIHDAAQAYLDVLRAKTFETVQRKNLEMSRSNLRLTRARFETGTVGRDELLRWSSQVAGNRRSLLTAAASRSDAEITLNRLLNRTLEEQFDTVETGLGDSALTVSFERLEPYIRSPRAFSVFRAFMIREALDSSPELRRMDAELRIRERQAVSARRAFFVPDLSVKAEVLGRQSAGSTAFFQNLGIRDVQWSVGVNASLPIDGGGELRARRSQSRIELDQLKIQREAIRLAIEQRIRSALLRAGASYHGIEFAGEAAVAARESYDLVREGYSEGVVSIVRLLDAQATAFSAEFSAASAIYDHLSDLMTAQRAVGRFDYFRSPDDREAWLKRLDDYFARKQERITPEE